jgi:hypothetical protein
MHPSLPNNGFHAIADSSGELRLVGRRARVDPIGGKFPNDRVQHFILKGDLPGVLPKHGEFMKVLNREAGGNVEVEDPSIVCDRPPSGPIFPTGDSVNGGCYPFGAEPILLRILPKNSP